MSRRRRTTHQRALLAMLLLPAAPACVSWLSTGLDEVERQVDARIGPTPLPGEDGRSGAEAILEDGRLSMDEAVRGALLGNWHLRAEFERLEIARARVLAAVLPPNPTATGEWSALLDRRTGHQFELTVTQSVIDLLLIPLRKDVADARRAQEIDEVSGAVIDLVVDTRRAYRDLQMQEALVRVLEDTAEATALAAEAARRLRAAGNVIALDVLTREAREAEVRIDVARARRRAFEMRERLAFLLGLPPDAPVDFVLDLPDPLPEPWPAAGEDLERLAVERSLDLSAARHALDALAETVGVERLEHAFPTLAAGTNGERVPHGPWDSEGPIVETSIPVFDFGQAASAEARARFRRAYLEFTQLALEVRRRTREEAIRVASLAESARFQTEVTLPARRAVTKATQEQVNAMQLGVFDLLRAKEHELRAERRLLHTRRRYWDARLRLDALLWGRMPSGQGWSDLDAGATGMDFDTEMDGRHDAWSREDDS